MPSRKHIVVVQDLASRFPAGKIVTSMKASSVILALTDIYDNCGNPEQQLSDNGTPFNTMNSFCRERNIEMAKIPPLHPSANPAETFMKSIGKSMKIAHHNNTSEKKVLAQLLSNYRDTPHPSTGVTPNDMLFQHLPQSVFPRKDITEQTIKTAQKRDELLKQGRTEKVNSTNTASYPLSKLVTEYSSEILPRPLSMIHISCVTHWKSLILLKVDAA